MKKDKKFIIRLISVAVLCVLVLSNSLILTSSYTATPASQFSYSVLSDNTVMITAYNGNSENLVIPDTINGLKVTQLGAWLFSANKTVKSVRMTNNITKLNAGVFYSSNVMFVSLSKNLQYIGNKCFYGCDQLKSIQIPSGVLIYESAFEHCDKLSTVIFEGPIELSGSSQFRNCPLLNDIYIPEGCYAEYDSGLGWGWQNVDQRKAYNINIYCYKGLSSNFGTRYASNKNIVYVNDLRRKTYTDSSYGIKMTTLCDSGIDVGLISAQSILNKYSSYVSQNEKITRIYDIALVNEKKNKSFFFDSAEMQIPVTNTNTKVYFIEDDDSLTNVNAVYKNGYMNFTTYRMGKYLITESNSTPVVTPTNPPAVTPTNPSSNNIIKGTYWSFNQSTGKLTIFSNGRMPDYEATEANNIPYRKYSQNITSIEISNSVTYIGKFAFAALPNFKSIIIPDSVTEIGFGAFYMCTNLSNVTLGKGLKIIGECAFTAMKLKNNLYSITIPDNVQRIDANAIGYVYNYNSQSFELVPNFKIYGSNNSIAKTYANNNNIQFIATTPVATQPPASTQPKNTQSVTNSNKTIAKKIANTMKVTVKKKTVKAKKLKKKKLVVKPISVKKAKGKVTFKKVMGDKELKVNKNTGKITIKKKTKKGKYNIYIKIYAKGNSKYKSKTIEKAVCIRVK